MAYSNNINVGINVPVGKSGHFFEVSFFLFLKKMNIFINHNINEVLIFDSP